MTRSRARLLGAATEILVESGALAVTVDAVVDRSGVAKSTLYRHWSSRAELLTDVLETNVPRIELPDLAGGFEPALRSLVKQMASTLADPSWARVVLELGSSEHAIPEALDAELIAFQLLGPLVLAALAGRAVDTTAMADHLVDRFIASYRDGPGPLSSSASSPRP